MKILWNDSEPWLLVRDNHDGTWHVVNGHWTLVWDGTSMHATAQINGDHIRFTHATDVDPSKQNDSYNKILNEARR